MASTTRRNAERPRVILMPLLQKEIAFLPTRW